ncbi:MAG: PTS sugar transporter subunit IIA [Myxococcales bacterium]|nr:PTS sugar transporter subunit IIA [Myxococcales bacterium]
MRIVDLMSEALVIPDLQGVTRDEVLGELVSCIVAATPSIDASLAFRVFQERERIGSTGVGQGLAIPHARLPSLDTAVACFARSRAGVEFKALDGQPTHLFLALLAPAGNAGFHLKALARASRMFKDSSFRARLMTCEDAAGLWAALTEKDNALSLQP